MRKSSKLEPNIEVMVWEYTRIRNAMTPLKLEFNAEKSIYHKISMMKYLRELSSKIALKKKRRKRPRKKFVKTTCTGSVNLPIAGGSIFPGKSTRKP